MNTNLSKQGNRTPVILAIESSADMASAAVLANGAVVQRAHKARHGHAAQITELARGALAEAGISADDLTHVVAGRGPGSFTGIRVALAAAKGFVIATGAGGVGVSCLAAMAHAAHAAQAGRDDIAVEGGGRVIATADTRRGSFFAQLFDAAGMAESDVVEIDPDAPEGCPESWQRALVTGPGAAMVAAAYPDAGMTPLAGMDPLDAAQLARLAAARIAAGDDLDPLLPLYVAPAFLGPSRQEPVNS